MPRPHSTGVQRTWKDFALARRIDRKGAIMPNGFDQTLEQVCRHARATALLDSIEGLLGWDERTMMPPAAADDRLDRSPGI